MPSRGLRRRELGEVGVGGHHLDLAHLLAQAFQVSFDLLNAMLGEVTRPFLGNFPSLHGRRFERRLPSSLMLRLLLLLSAVFLSLGFLGSALLNNRSSLMRFIQRHIRVDDDDVLIAPIVQGGPVRLQQMRVVEDPDVGLRLSIGVQSDNSIRLNAVRHSEMFIRNLLSDSQRRLGTVEVLEENLYSSALDRAFVIQEVIL